MLWILPDSACVKANTRAGAFRQGAPTPGLPTNLPTERGHPPIQSTAGSFPARGPPPTIGCSCVREYQCSCCAFLPRAYVFGKNECWGLNSPTIRSEFGVRTWGHATPAALWGGGPAFPGGNGQVAHVWGRVPLAATHTDRQRGDLSPCGQSPMDFESITLATRSHCQLPPTPERARTTSVCSTRVANMEAHNFLSARFVVACCCLGCSPFIGGLVVLSADPESSTSVVCHWPDCARLFRWVSSDSSGACVQMERWRKGSASDSCLRTRYSHHH